MRLTNNSNSANRYLRPVLLLCAAALLQSCAQGGSSSGDADISVTGTSEEATIAQGDKATFRVTVKNNGPSDAANVHITDTVGKQSSLVSIRCEAKGNAKCPSTTGPSMRLDSLPKSGSLEFVVSVVLTDPGTGTILNSMSADVAEDKNPNNNVVNNDVLVR